MFGGPVNEALWTVETKKERYTLRLVQLERVWWKRLLDVQAPYRWNLRRMHLGKVLDVGCGVGRNLRSLERGSVGIDHNEHAVNRVLKQGLTAFLPEGFLRSAFAKHGGFDSLLFSHVLEHLSAGEGVKLLRTYLPFVKGGGRVVFITPQKRGFGSDATHVRFVGFEELAALAREVGLTITRQYSFPFPRRFGRVFKYNEHVMVATREGLSSGGT